MASLLDFVERVRVLQDLPATGVIVFAGTEPDDDTRCVLATALGCRVEPRQDDDGDWHYVMCFQDRLLARRIGICMELSWTAEPPTVRLPEAIADLSVAQSHGTAEPDELGLLRCWWVEDEYSGWHMFTPHDELLGEHGWYPPAPRR